MNVSYFRNFLFLFILLFAVSANANEYPKIKQLKNGLTVLVIEDHKVPLVTSRMYINVGASMEKEGQRGISHFIEHMLFRGSKSHPEGITSLVENKGGDLNAYTSNDETVYYNNMPSADWEASMEAIQGVVFDPFFRASDLDVERKVVLAEIKQSTDKPEQKMFYLILENMLKGTPYEHPVLGYEEELRKLVSQDLKNYVDTFYSPNNMLLVVAGDIETEKVFHKAEQLFSEYTNKATQEILTPYTNAEIKNLGQGFDISIEKGKFNKSHVSLSFPTPAQNSKEAIALSMLANLLTFDDNALLLQEFRFKEELTDNIYAYNMGFKRLGIFSIYATLDSEKIEPFLEKMVKLLSTLNAEQFSQAEFDQVKNSMENVYLQLTKTIQSKAGFYGDAYFNNPSDPLGQDWLEKFQNINKEDINLVIKDYIRPDAMHLATVLPEEKNLDEASLKKMVASTWPNQTKPQAEATSESKAEILQIENKTLVLIKDNEIPFFGINIEFLGGESLLTLTELQKKDFSHSALPRVTASVLTTATRDMDKKQLTAYLSQKDISIGASTTTLSFNLSAYSPTKFSKETLSTLRKIIETPAFSKDDLEDTQTERVAYIESMKDSVTASLSNALFPFLFPNQTFGHDKNGTEQGVMQLTPADLNLYWNKQREQAMVISVAGDFDKESIINFVKGLHNPTHSIKNPQIIVESPIYTNKKSLFVPVEGRNQDYTLYIFPTVDKSHQDAPALEVLSRAIQGMNGLVFQELREKRNLGYSAGAFSESSEKTGYLGYYIIASAEHQDAIKEQFKAITDTLQKNGLSDLEIQKAKASLQMDYVNANQTPESRANVAASAVLHNRDVDFTKQYLDKILKVTKKDVQDVINKYLITDKAYYARSGAK